ncbi:hypothetical protein L0N18_23985, partial [Phocaeicola dorei]|nr:hypothetical protein [Phocaeicola dorei]MCG4616645.1 hypothetical protein [Phocaeicola dorei]MCG4639816.1 hypothetical protein [Phocaeicola dorei]
VRQVMVVLELLIEKVRSVGGQLCVSAANGKIKTAVLEDGYWRITFEQDNSFQAHDLMRCATFSGGNLKGYWVEVAGVEGDSILVSEDEFSGSLPEAGDECVLMGNTENPLRQNLILISATEDGQPRVDVMDGVKAKNFTGCLRARLGNLDGISDDWFPADNQPHGNGLYSDNAYLRGTFLLVTGEDIKTKFEIVEGRITSAVTALRNDFATEKGYLNNPAFDDGLEKWNTENETVFFLAGNKWIWANNNVLTRKGDGASVTVDDGRTVVHIRNKYILQKRANLKSIPSMPVNGDGEKEAVPVYLSFFYRCATKGTLRVQFLDVDKTGFANFNSLEVEEELSATDGYVQYTCSGLWNGTGDFKLSFTGDIYLYMLVLSTDKVESLAHRYRTLFEQSERLVKITAAVFDRDENMLEETGLVVKPEGAGIYAQDADGKLALIGVSVDGTDADGNKISVVKLTGDRVKLEGLVTANDNFKILEDGSIEANAGTFSGHIRTNFHLVESSDAVLTSCSGRGEAGYLIGRELSLKVDMAGSSNGADIILPNDVRYIGSRVTLYNGCHPPYTRTVGSIRYSSVRVDDGTLLRGSNVNLSSDSLLSYSDPYRIDWISGIIELVGTPELNGRILADLVSWRGASAGPPASPSSGWLYYDTKRNRNYLYWYGAWVEFPVYGGASDDLRITWKGELSSSPENPERNWLYVTSVNRFLLLYTGEDWEEPAIINSLNKCGWCILGFSALSYHYYND